MTFKKETFIFLTSLALILIIGYINVVMSSDKPTFNEPELNEEELAKKQEEFANDINLNEFTDITDLSDVGKNDILTVSSTDENIDVSFENFKISKEKNNLNIVDQLEKNISSDKISDETKAKFENLLIIKNNQIQMENSIEIMLQSKGYEDFVCIVNSNSVKVITVNDITKADASKILDVVISETSFEPSQIKIVKFNNKEL